MDKLNNDLNKIINNLQIVGSTLDVFTKLCELSIKERKFRWNVNRFEDDPVLDDIYPGLRQIILDGKASEQSRRWYSTILIRKIKSLDNIVMECTNDNSKIGYLKFHMNMEQLKMFVDYIAEHGICLF